ncbi:lysoplasmalogenase [Streptomyces sp. NPDC020965]|uniref:lysoplasmalogenase n=1 Tax=Streptomyces sp. NPDC020965 TaxID=3365105 RepID=UPI0037ABE755
MNSPDLHASMSPTRPIRPTRLPGPAGPVILALFAAAVLVDLGSLLLGAETGHRIAKPLLMPLLAAYTAVRGGPRLLVCALLLGWGGDVFLLSDADWAFLVGMGSFAVGHVCYLVLFGRGGTPRWLGPLYAVLLVAALVLLWPGLPAELRVPVAAYATLLTVMAWRAAVVGPLAAAGGALFLVSDLIIAIDVAEMPQPPATDFWIMFLYSMGQLLLMLGLLARHRTRRSG